MKKIKVWVGTRYVGSTVRDEIEVDGDTSEKEVEEIVREWVADTIEWGWEAQEDDK